MKLHEKMAILLETSSIPLHPTSSRQPIYNNVIDTIRFSFGIAIKHFITTIQIAIVPGFVIYCNATMSALVNYVTLIIGVDLPACWFTFYCNAVFEKNIRSAKDTEALNTENSSVKRIYHDEDNQS